MQLVINSFGSYLHVKESCFELKAEGKKRKISIQKIDSILIATKAGLSTDAINLALKNNIEIQFLDEYGQPAGKIWHSKLGSTTAIRRRQLEIAENEEGTELVKKFITDKLDNMVSHLEDLANRRDAEKAEVIENYTESIKEFINKIELTEGIIDDVRNTLMSYEGNAGRKYYEALSYLVPERYSFKGRNYRPAEDEFNCLLNYGYGVLYSKAEKACIIAGLDPYVGILHTDNYNKLSFVFDVIERYRHLIDRLVMKLLGQKKVNKSYFDEVPGGLTLNEDGRKFFIKNLNEYFNEMVSHNDRPMRRNNIIQADMHRLANSLIETEEEG